MTWPHQRDLSAFYGDPDRNDDGSADPAWEAANLVHIPAPWAMVAAWNTKLRINRIRVHKKCADAFGRVFERIKVQFQTQENIQRARLHLFGGAYVFRAIRGGARLSTHAYGCAIDLDPEGNPLGQRWKPGMIDERVVKAFKAEGADWGGDWKTRPDCQHFQFAGDR
jgi:hypothetical protein